jgi:SAM-dependent methyltransferase
MDLSEIPTGSFLRHPWELARARFFLGELRRAGVLEGSARVLDVGSGDAWFAGLVADANRDCNVVCWDLGYEHAKPAARDRVAFTATAPEGNFDVLMLLDVAEHVPDDRAFLRQVMGLMRPGAVVLFSVPAWPALYTQHDEALRHYRRYTPRQARALLGDSGIRITRSGGLFHSLLLPRSIAALRERRPDGVTLTDRSPPPPSGLAWTSGRATHATVMGALAIDGWLSRLAASTNIDLPGLSFWAIGCAP